MVAESKNGRKIDLLLPDNELFSLILVKLDRKEKKLKAKSIKKSLSKICLIIKIVILKSFGAIIKATDILKSY